MKYVMINFNGRELPIIFPKELVHKDVYQFIRQMLIHQSKGDWQIKPSSAGFITLGAVKCHGESETLKLKSLGPEDDRHIQMIDYNAGMRF